MVEEGLALLCTVPLGLPGLIGTVNPSITIGAGGVHLFDISYIMEVRYCTFLYSMLKSNQP